MRLWSGLVAVVWLAVSVLDAREASSDSKYAKEAERRNHRANRFYKAGKYEDALQLYQAAYDLDPLPSYLFNIGLAREKTFDYEGCAIAFERFIEGTGDEPARKSLRERAADRLARCRERVVIPLSITSMPPYAGIYLGTEQARKLRGRTPAKLELPPGVYSISVELTGYVGQTREVTVELGTRPEVDFMLDKISQLRIEVDPGGAVVEVDERAPESAPLSREVAPGMHRVRVTKDGFEPMERQVRVEAGDQVSLVLTLKPLPTIRNVAIETKVPAGVWIDGVQLGSTPLTHQLEPGTHDLEVAAPGRLPYASAIKIPDRDSRVLVELTPKRTQRQRTIFWAVVGAAGLAAVTGGTYGILMLRRQADFNDAQTPALRDSVLGHARKADVWLGTALVLGSSALIYRYLTRPAPSRATVVGQPKSPQRGPAAMLAP